MKPTARAIARSILILSLAAVTLLILLELTARVHFFGLPGLDPRKVNSTYRLLSSGYVQRSRHRELGFELKPDIDGYFKLARFRTNSRGLRDEEYPLEKPEGTFRVAVLGSSFTLPSGVEIEHAFHSLLEERLREELSPTHYEFINFAVGSYGPSQAVGMLERRALDYDPDLILFAITGMSEPWMTKPLSRVGPMFEERARTYPFLRSYLLQLLQGRAVVFGRRQSPEKTRWDSRIGVLERLVMWVGERRSTREAPAPGTRRHGGGRTEPLPSKLRSDPPEKPARQTVLERLGEITAETGIPIVVVRLAFQGPKRNPSDSNLEALIRADRMYFLDTRDAFESPLDRDLWIYRVDPHPNAAAHQTFADVIASFLQSKHLLSPVDRP